MADDELSLEVLKEITNRERKKVEIELGGKNVSKKWRFFCLLG